VKLINFFELVDIFPKDYNVKREMMKDFFWDRVRRQKKEGSERTAKKENIEISIGTKELHDRMCHQEFSRDDFGEFESNTEDEGSVQSTAST